jgi:hypothetical protein
MSFPEGAFSRPAIAIFVGRNDKHVRSFQQASDFRSEIAAVQYSGSGRPLCVH